MDANTRCIHYHGPCDIVAIRMRCCGVYYACKDCHEELAGHASEVWPCREWDRGAVVCGICGTEMSIQRYLASGDRCPACGSGFNPGCRSHRHFYFEEVSGDSGSSRVDRRQPKPSGRL